jgi:hypothetical protein
MSEHLLSGLDPQKFVGWMAAMGALRLSSVRFGEDAARMHWDRVALRPVLRIDHADAPADDAALCGMLCDEVRELGRRVATLGGVGSVSELSQDEFGALLDRAVDEVERADGPLERRRARLFLDWISGHAFDGSCAEGKAKKDDDKEVEKAQKPEYALSPLLMVPGSSHVANAILIADKIARPEIVRASLFGAWTYAAPPKERGKKAEDVPNAVRMFWDAQEELSPIQLGIPPKLELKKPFERGVLPLAVAALATVPVLPTSDGRKATASRRASTNRKSEVLWPVWDAPVTRRTAEAIVHAPGKLDTGSFARFRAAVLDSKSKDNRCVVGNGRLER